MINLSNKRNPCSFKIVLDNMSFTSSGALFRFVRNAVMACKAVNCMDYELVITKPLYDILAESNKDVVVQRPEPEQPPENESLVAKYNRIHREEKAAENHPRTIFGIEYEVGTLNENWHNSIYPSFKDKDAYCIWVIRKDASYYVEKPEDMRSRTIDWTVLSRKE